MHIEPMDRSQRTLKDIERDEKVEEFEDLGGQGLADDAGEPSLPQAYDRSTHHKWTQQLDDML